MKIYVTVETYQGVVENVFIFKKEKQAQRKEAKWLKELKVHDDKKREELSFHCTTFSIFECELKKN